MFLLTCPTCQCDYLVGARSVARLHNLRPGMIVVELSCPQGHRVLEMTGSQRAPDRQAASTVAALVDACGMG